MKSKNQTRPGVPDLLAVIAACAVCVITLGGCSSNSRMSAPDTTTPSTTAGLTLTGSTIPADIKPLCATATRKLADYWKSHDQNRIGDTTASTLTDASLKDCASRIEWLTAMERYTGHSEDDLDGVYSGDCIPHPGLTTPGPGVTVPTGCGGG